MGSVIAIGEAPRRVTCLTFVTVTGGYTVNASRGDVLGALLRLPHVQLWEAENHWRLGSSYRGGYRCDIPCLVDASDVRTVNALKTRPALAMLQQRSY